MVFSIEDLEKEVKIILSGVQSGSKSVEFGTFQLLKMMTERENFLSKKFNKLIELLKEV